jgi:hypothetical protein
MVRNILKKLIYLLPESLGVSIIKVWRFRRLWRFWLERLKLKLPFSRSVTKYLSDDAIYWVDPEKIVFAMNSDGFTQDTLTPEKRKYREFNDYEYKGRVIGGDWDGLERRFSELDFYRSYEERARKGTSWEQLPYYHRVLGQIENGIVKWSCKSKQDLDERCKMLDRIFNDMKHDGYRSRELQGKERDRKSLFDEADEISVNIGRHGDLIFNNGRHRLTLAKVAGLKEVPVTITVRHSKWEELKQEIEARARRDNGRLYAALTHIDLQNVPSHYGHGRYEIIRKNVGEGNSTVLDIGANWGYFCHRFEEDGFHCTAVENDAENLYFMRKLKRAENRSFKVIAESITTMSKRGPLKYDIVLALAIFHHFLKEKETFEELKHLLKTIDAKEMYFEPHRYDESQMGGSFINLPPEEFTIFIMENSCLNHCQLIGRCEEDRPIYKLWR